jgi:hypothetical protein
MGYDMYWVHDKDDPRNYFRLNIFGMSRFADAMYQLGALRDGYTDESPSWPDEPEGYWAWKDGCVEVGEDQATVYRKVEEQYRAKLTWSPAGEVTGIPAHKLGTNDGWIVTPEECFVAASTIRSADPDRVAQVLASCEIARVDYWNDWVQWIADASEHGGFEVH